MTDTPNWFRINAEANFRAFALDTEYLSFRDEIHVLQLGVFAGHASEWIAKFLLTNPLSTLTDVDTWAGSEEAAHDAMDFAKIETEYDARVAEFGDKVQKNKMTTDAWFRSFPPTANAYDLIYIDADHTAIGTLEDAVKSHGLLKVGGLLVFDDYVWTADDASPYNAPKLAIDSFMRVYGNKYETVAVNAQAWLRKVA